MEPLERIQRYFLVIRELHRMGYELIRVCPCFSPNGISWRCATTVKKFTLKNCGAIYHGPEHTAARTCDGKFAFGECERMTPREIAERFLDHYKHLAKWGNGSDPEYVAWFQKACDLAQRGYVFYAFDDYGSCFKNKHRMLLSGNPPSDVYLPFPPAGEMPGKIIGA